ncbi:unnamed protein product [Bursaphelenchus okinawaensis]|uniref:Uncharacterized protein n=1 Tax=Bursaphelenchus okinawaensis TaxID=465554 RepID=A0A811KTW2_9BILA|nr:unnamed protein product [Bursaphelenchus okinawaensis]CAG9112299.1 unnamed protein product [Bursaphelenchus okinawaensis]
MIRVILLTFLVSVCALQKRDVALDIKEKYGNLKDDCFPRPGSEGCRCTMKGADGVEETKLFEQKSDCVKPIVVQTAENKAKLNEEFNKKFGGLREGCFPRPGKGCRCTVKDAQGEEVTKNYDTHDECTGPSAEAKENKAKLNEEFNKKYGGNKENCFPRPGKGCRCVEKDASGNEQTKLYDNDADCKVEVNTRQKREPQRERSQSPSQNVRDPVREKAQANYQAVVNELKEKFRGLKEGCYPRPKGCLCVVGNDKDGHQITERRMKESDCKCQPGERGPSCPADGA